MAALCACGSRVIAIPQSYGVFSHLCPSVAQLSARAIPFTTGARRGLAFAHKPKAPSTCTQAPLACDMGQRTSKSSHAPMLRSPAFRITIVGASGACANAACSTSASTLPDVLPPNSSMQSLPKPRRRKERVTDE